jgi:hypothetical protein
MLRIRNFISKGIPVKNRLAQFLQTQTEIKADLRSVSYYVPVTGCVKTLRRYRDKLLTFETFAGKFDVSLTGL